jgi:NhaP-type Na+/H+ and K+/H+ antiporter
MTAPLSAERVEELRGWLGESWERIDEDELIYVASEKDKADLLSILSSYSSLRAENERLRGYFDEAAKLRAEVRGLTHTIGGVREADARTQAHVKTLLQDNASLKAQLAKVAPLVEAVMELGDMDFISDYWPSEKLRDAADKYREGEK